MKMTGMYDNTKPKSAKETWDTKTEIMYPSRNKAGQGVAKEFGLEPHDPHVWFEVLRIESLEIDDHMLEKIE